MGLSIRTLLIWWLILAVPAQGAAAATMAFCGPNHHGSPHHGSPATAAAAQPHSAAQQHQHAGVEARPVQALSPVQAHAHGHPAVPSQADAQADVVATVDAATAATPEAITAATPGASHKCSACATCCSVAAMLSRLPTVPAAEPSTTRFAAVVITVDTFAVDGPDRPPRRLHA